MTPLRMLNRSAFSQGRTGGRDAAALCQEVNLAVSHIGFNTAVEVALAPEVVQALYDVVS